MHLGGSLAESRLSSWRFPQNDRFPRIGCCPRGKIFEVSPLLPLFVAVPAVELVLLIEIGRRIGTLPTLGLIVVTGALGAYLARRQGLGVLRRMREETAAGRLPAARVMDGINVLIAGALLVTPGILTDSFGFF